MKEGNSLCKGPEAELLICSRRNEGASVTGEKLVRGRDREMSHRDQGPCHDGHCRLSSLWILE